MTDRNAEIESQIPHLRRYALALTRDAEAADDLVQETVLRALSRWRLRRPGLPLRPWLFTMLRNLHVSSWRSRSRMVQPAEGQIEALAAPDAAPETRAELAQVLDLLAALPEAQRSAVLLVSVEGFSYDEAARIMGVPPGTLMSRLSRARERLRSLAATPPAHRLRRVK